MSLYAIGDLHLSFGVDKPMDRFGGEWHNHAARIEKYWKKRIGETDTVVLTGDHSWGRNLRECAQDLAFIERLPGRKILLRGNHDMFWDAKKTNRLNGQFAERLFFLQNNFAVYEDYALVGTKGYSYEGRDTEEHFEKIRDREAGRLRVSFEAARAAGFQKYLMFLHYPPTSIGEQESVFTQMAQEYGAEKVVYSHCHGQMGYLASYTGMVEGIEYLLVSADYLKFKPICIMK